MSSIKVKYLSAIHPHFKDGLLKGDLKNLSDDENVFHTSPHQYYEARNLECISGVKYEDDECEKNYWKELTLAEFWSKYDIFYGKNEKGTDSLIK